jgi:hypothetical protein
MIDFTPLARITRIASVRAQQLLVYAGHVLIDKDQITLVAFLVHQTQRRFVTRSPPPPLSNPV